MLRTVILYTRGRGWYHFYSRDQLWTWLISSLDCIPGIPFARFFYSWVCSDHIKLSSDVTNWGRKKWERKIDCWQRMWFWWKSASKVLATPLERSLSFSTGTFWYNYDIMGKESQVKLIHSNVEKCPIRMPDTTWFWNMKNVFQGSNSQFSDWLTTAQARPSPSPQVTRSWTIFGMAAMPVLTRGVWFSPKKYHKRVKFC